MAKAANTLERTILQAAAIHPRVGALYRFNGGVFGPRRVRACPNGWPDLAGWMRDGRALLVEVKAATDYAMPHQVEFLDEAKAAGAVAGIARSVDDFLKLVEG